MSKSYKYAKLVKIKLHLLFTLVKSNSDPFGAETSDGDCDRSGWPFSFSSATGKRRFPALHFHPFFNSFTL